MSFPKVLAMVMWLILCPTVLLASELSGQVLKGSGQPASDIPVRLIGPKPATQEQDQQTNKSGFYKFKDLEPGKYTVTVDGRSTEVHVFGRKTRRDLRLP